MEKPQTKLKRTVNLFELPQRLGILQYVEYEPPQREWCTAEGCPYEGILLAEGCKKGVCIKYRAWVFSRDGREWWVSPRPRRKKEESGGLSQWVADILMELAERHTVEIDRDFTIIIDGTPIGMPSCRSPEECRKEILSELKRAREAPPPPPPPAEEEYKRLIEKYVWLRQWRKDVVIEYLKREKRLFLEVLERLANPEVPDIVPLFLSRFDIVPGCSVEVFRGIDDDKICVSFCVNGKIQQILVYCYERGEGWRPLEGALRPFRVGIVDGRLRDIYIFRNESLVPKRYVRIV
jgi:hypothetical protein